MQYAAGRYDQAVESFAAFEDRLAASPWQPNARLGRGLALLKLNRPAEAIKQFDAVLATPSTGEELLEQATPRQGSGGAAGEGLRRRGSRGGRVREAISQERDGRRRAADAGPLAGGTQGVSLGPPPCWSRWSSRQRHAAGNSSDLENRYLLAVSYEGLKRYPEALAALLPVVDVADRSSSRPTPN